MIEDQDIYRVQRSVPTDDFSVTKRARYLGRLVDTTLHT